MKLQDILSEITKSIKSGSTMVQLGSKTYQLKPITGNRVQIVLKTKTGEITIESASPNERTLVSQAVKNFGHTILHVRGLESDPLAGSIDGRYVKDVEFECTRLVLQETA